MTSNTTPGLSGTIMFVDIYHGDPVIDFAASRRYPLYGLIHKATQGVGPRAHDPLYHDRRDKWKTLPPIAYTRADGNKVDIPPLWGAYDFNTGDPVKDQVSNFLAIAQLQDGDLGCLDFEDNAHSPMSLEQGIEWLQRFSDATGQLAKIYSGNRIKQLITKATSAQRDFLGMHDFWLCQYGRNAVLLDVNHHPLPWAKYWAWQRDADNLGPDTHGVPGISPTGIDQDVFDGTPEELMASWVKRGARV